jgi:hypothetical protein
MVRVEATMYKTVGDFTDFHSDPAVNLRWNQQRKRRGSPQVKKMIVAEIVRVA